MTLTFFTDRDLGIQFPTILRDAGLTVEKHRDHFAPDAPDEDWLREVGTRGWVAVTHDGRIRYKPNEKAAVLTHGVRLLVVIGNLPYAVLAESFVLTFPRIRTFIERHEAPFIARVYRATDAERKLNALAAGRVELSYPRR